MTEKSVLDNGTEIITKNIRNSKSVTISIVFKLGSRNESKNNGISHLLEHIITLNGSKYYTGQEISFEIEKFGAIFNAITTKEITAFYSVCLAKDLEKIVSLMSEIVLYPAITESFVKNEKPIIIQEIAKENGWGEHFNNLISYIYKGSGLENKVTGSKESIEKINCKDIEDFYNSNYVSSNMFIVASGDIKHNEIEKIVSSKFDKKNTHNNKKTSNLSPRPYFNSGEIKNKLWRSKHCYISVVFPTTIKNRKYIIYIKF